MIAYARPQYWFALGVTLICAFWHVVGRFV